MTDKMKESIIGRYSQIATGQLSSCGCDDSCCPPATAEKAAPAGLEDMNLGCGAPLEHAEIEEGMTVLDLGSGGGREVFLASKIVGETGRALGIDMTGSMVELARRNAGLLGIGNTEFHLAEIERMPFPDGSVDRIISNCVLNLTPDKEKAFREMFRVLKPGGRFAVADIVGNRELPASIRSNPDLWCSCVAGAIPIQKYLDGLRAAGFTDVAVVSEQADALRDQGDFGLLSITVTGKK